MALPEIQMVKVRPVTQRIVRSGRIERLLRRSSGWFMFCCLLMGQLGAPWDGEWHAYVGRDWFWTPPHALIYSCVGGGGLIALVMVLVETWRYRKGYVDDQSTVCILRVFHAPLGYVVVGYGALAALFAAPFDNYWHQLYGIDISLWSPFHIMGVTGCFIGTLGIVYVLASEIAVERKSERKTRRWLGFSVLEWGALFVLASLLKLTLTGFLLFPVLEIGLLRIPTYMLPAVLCAGLCLVGASRLTARPGAATCMTLLLGITAFATELFVPWATRGLVQAQGLHYRVPGLAPYFKLNIALLPLFLLPSALIVDGIAFWQMRRGKKPYGKQRHMWLLGLLMSIPQMIIAPCLIMWTANPFAAFLNTPDMLIAPSLKLYTALLAVPVILVVGIVGAVWGASAGDTWYLSRQ
jgi:hypothetical protein